MPQPCAMPPLPNCNPVELVYYLSPYCMKGTSMGNQRPADGVALALNPSHASKGKGQRLLVRNYMTPICEVPSTGPNATIVEAVATMKHQEVSKILVVQSGVAIGLLTLNCVLQEVIIAGRSKESPVKDIMVQDLHTIDCDSTHDDAVHLLHKKVVHCLVVSGEDGQCLGVVTSYDIARLDAKLLHVSITNASTCSVSHERSAHDREDYGTMKQNCQNEFLGSVQQVGSDYSMLLPEGSIVDTPISEPSDSGSGLALLAPQATDIMIPKDRVLVCATSMPVAQVAAGLFEKRSTAAVVMQCNTKAVGIVTRPSVILSCILGQDDGQGPVSAIMDTPVTIKPDFSRNQAASMIHRYKVHHLVVADEEEVFLGMVTSLDIARMDAATLRRNLDTMRSGSPVEVTDDNADFGMVQIGTRVSVTLDATCISSNNDSQC